METMPERHGAPNKVMSELLFLVFVETCRFLSKDKSENTFIKYVCQGRTIEPFP